MPQQVRSAGVPGRPKFESHLRYCWLWELVLRILNRVLSVSVLIPIRFVFRFARSLRCSYGSRTRIPDSESSLYKLKRYAGKKSINAKTNFLFVRKSFVIFLTRYRWFWVEFSASFWAMLTLFWRSCVRIHIHNVDPSKKKII